MQTFSYCLAHTKILSYFDNGHETDGCNKYFRTLTMGMSMSMSMGVTKKPRKPLDITPCLCYNTSNNKECNQ